MRDDEAASAAPYYLTDAGGDRLLKLAEVTARVSLGKTTIYAKIHEGSFPSPVGLGGAVRWRKSEIDAWMAALQPTVTPTAGRAPSAAS